MRKNKKKRNIKGGKIIREKTLTDTHSRDLDAREYETITPAHNVLPK